MGSNPTQDSFFCEKRKSCLGCISLIVMYMYNVYVRKYTYIHVVSTLHSKSVIHIHTNNIHVQSLTGYTSKSRSYQVKTHPAHMYVCTCTQPIILAGPPPRIYTKGMEANNTPAYTGIVCDSTPKPVGDVHPHPAYTGYDGQL